jgi:hypothetical protein
MEAVLAVDDGPVSSNDDGLDESEFADGLLQLADLGRVDATVQLVEVEL